MRLLIFADPRGREAAVEAILDVAKRVGDCEVVCLGNACGSEGGAEVVDRLRRRGVLLVAGPLDKVAARKGTMPPAEMAFLRAASVPRRWKAGPRLLWLTWDPQAEDRAAFVVKPGDVALIDGRGAILPRVADSGGEASILLVDLGSGELELRTVTWDAATTRHV